MRKNKLAKMHQRISIINQVGKSEIQRMINIHNNGPANVDKVDFSNIPKKKEEKLKSIFNILKYF